MKMRDHFALPVQWHDWRLVGLQEGDQDKAAAHAINCHDELVEALEDARDQLGKYELSRTGETYNDPKINAILNKAKGE